MQHGARRGRPGSPAGPRSAGARGSSRARSRPWSLPASVISMPSGSAVYASSLPMSCSSAPHTATSRSMPGNVAEIAETAWATREGVLQQPVAVGLVVALRRRRVAEGRPGVGRPARTPPRAARAGGRSGPWRGAGAGRPPSGRRRAAGRPAARTSRPRPGRRRAGRRRRSAGRARGCTAKRPRTWTAAPGESGGRAVTAPGSDAPSPACGAGATAATQPDRSASTRRRKAEPSRRVRSSRSRTSRMASMSWPSVNWRTSIGGKRKPALGRFRT